jgi:hypothetical protein
VWVKRYHMGMTFNCGSPKATTTSMCMLFLPGTCWLYELHVSAL